MKFDRIRPVFANSFYVYGLILINLGY